MAKESLAVQAFLDNIRQHADRLCLIEGDRQYTYQDLFDSIGSIRRQIIEKKISRQAVIGIRGDYSFGNISLFFALARERLSVALLGAWSDRENERRTEQAGVTGIASVSGGNLDVRPLSLTKPRHEAFSKLNGPGLILFSSGTTGAPKVMLHDFGKMIARYGYKKNKDYRILLFLLFDHVGGLDTLLRGLNNGSALVVPEKRHPHVVAKAIEKYSVNVLPSTPTALNLLLVAEVLESCDLSSLKIISYGAEPMTESLLNRLHRAFPWVQFQQKFGISETHVVGVRSRASNDLELRIDDSNVGHKIVDGELYLKSASSIVAYLNVDKNPLDDDGWFHTGDQVELLEDGFLRIKGRLSDVVNVGGEKVLPSEVESVLGDFPGIEDCVAYGAFNGITGQAVHVKVKMSNKEDLHAVRKAIRCFCKERLEPHARPVKIEIVDDLPHTRNLKKMRKKI